ncbi:recombinase family protein [Tropicimonas sp. IMCC34011]|uniref:recombinase family protein n=1 Tax=Tropicimonas sp. IMCC34011 TaxID=2248759 RepID=UPI000E28354B|nr:recombinase family protein [Tropicimonas sp. IMCC34011]
MIPDAPLRAAIYARYSSDLQSTASITDQVRVCQALCVDRGWLVVEVFTDEAMSGASHLRPGFQAMQQAAMNGRFDIIIAEALDRLSRDQEHIAALHKRMSFLDVSLVTKAEGEINEMHIGLGGTMSALFLKNLALKTHRGLEGRVRGGKSAGGRSYGYRPVRELQPDGGIKTGDLEIVPEEAAIVARIFEDYANGLSARAIAATLNAEGITSPGAGSGRWSFSTISGNHRRGTGILNNELYVGRRVWNRQRFIKDPDTGKRQARPNPPEMWITEDIAKLRLVDDALWHRVKARQGALRDEMNPAGVKNAALRPERARRPTYLLSGLIKCGCCGATYTLINKTRYGCSAVRNKGTAICTNRTTIRRGAVEERVLSGLRERLLHPALLDTFAQEYRTAWNAAQADTQAARAKAEQELAQVEKKIAGLLSAIEDGMYHPSMKEKMAGLEDRKRSLATQVAEAPEPPVLRMHPSLGDLYRQKIDDLVNALSDPAVRVQAAEAMRSLISEIRMVPAADAPDGHRIELSGDLAGILALGEAETTKPPRMARALSETMVAGVGFEPTTFRL